MARFKVFNRERKTGTYKTKKDGFIGRRALSRLLADRMYIDYTQSLGFGGKPNYAYLRNLFRSRFRSEGFKYDSVFN
jgi:hypothetical protein